MISDCDREVLLLVIETIKWPKQRPIVDSILKICHQIRDKLTQFMTRDGIESQVNHIIKRQLLEKFVEQNGCVVCRALDLAKRLFP